MELGFGKEVFVLVFAGGGGGGEVGEVGVGKGDVGVGGLAGGEVTGISAIGLLRGVLLKPVFLVRDF